ncbi:MAG TPA: hypothetical protein VD833_03695 [Vicinamibacterales bacterium]|nr:hypothetical protein [Vicinamibacterales bacterium]
MGRARPLALSSALLLGVVSVAAAQDSPAAAPPPEAVLVPLSADQERQLDKWLAAMDKWQRYDARWENRPVRDSWGRVTSRRTPPKAPDWLPGHCASVEAAGLLEIDERTTNACRLLDDPRTALESVPAPVQAARADDEKPQKHSSFLTRVHLDGLWTTSPSAGRFYGIVGSHVSLVDVGRLQVFGPPGVLLLSVPDGPDSRRLTLGFTWGVSLRLTDVRVFGPDKNMTLFLNISKVWVDSGQAGSNYRGFDIAGFSLAPRKKN